MADTLVESSTNGDNGSPQVEHSVSVALLIAPHAAQARLLFSIISLVFDFFLPPFHLPIHKLAQLARDFEVGDVLGV